MANRNYEVTVGYRSVVTLSVKAETEDDAKMKALEKFKKHKGKMFTTNHIALQDDNYSADGVLDLDATWNML